MEEVPYICGSYSVSGPWWDSIWCIWYMNLIHMYAQYCYTMGQYWQALFTAWQKFVMEELKDE